MYTLMPHSNAPDTSARIQRVSLTMKINNAQHRAATFHRFVFLYVLTILQVFTMVLINGFAA